MSNAPDEKPAVTGPTPEEVRAAVRTLGESLGVIVRSIAAAFQPLALALREANAKLQEAESRLPDDYEEQMTYYQLLFWLCLTGFAVLWAVLWFVFGWLAERITGR